MQGALRFFDTHQVAASHRFAVPLKQRHQDPKRAQRAVGHIASQETPWMLGSPHLLTEVERKLGAHGTRSPHR